MIFFSQNISIEQWNIIIQHQSSYMNTKTQKNKAKLKTQTASSNGPPYRFRQSIELIDIKPPTETPSQQSIQPQQLTSLFQAQLYNHNLRKEVQKHHNKTIKQFYKRKKNMVKLMNKQQIRKRKQADENNKVNQCSKYINTHFGCFDGSRTQIRGAGNGYQTYYPSLNVGKQNMSVNKINRLFQNACLSQGYLNGNSQSSHSLGKHTMPFQLANPHILGNNVNKRQVYLSNIANIDQLRKSLSYSKAKFHRKIIKMERQIGKYYIPFQDKLPGGQNCVKGIFM